jgi:hypothetical protein
MDVCCWNRPFDDQEQTRVHLEAEAVLAIVSEIEHHHCQLLHSEVVDLEIANVPNRQRRERLRALIPREHHYIRYEERLSARASELEQLGFPGIDALHLACAESAAANVFFTTDDRLLRLSTRHANLLRVKVANPLGWLQNRPAD